MECGQLNHSVKTKSGELAQIKIEIMDTIHDRINTEIEDQLVKQPPSSGIRNFMRGIYYLTIAKYFDPKAYRIAQKVMQRIIVKQHSNC